jgi:hypothetical protein
VTRDAQIADSNACSEGPPTLQTITMSRRASGRADPDHRHGNGVTAPDYAESSELDRTLANPVRPTELQPISEDDVSAKRVGPGSGNTGGATIRRMGVVKRSVSIDDGVAARVEAAAGEDGVSFSAWLSTAAEQSLLVRDGLRGVREWEAVAGPLTPAEIAAGEALLSRLLGETDF